MKQLNRLRRWEHDVCFHLLYYLVKVIVDWKNIKNYYKIYIEDEGREKSQSNSSRKYYHQRRLRRDKAQVSGSMNMSTLEKQQPDEMILEVIDDTAKDVEAGIGVVLSQEDGQPTWKVRSKVFGVFFWYTPGIHAMGTGFDYPNSNALTKKLSDYWEDNFHRFKQIAGTENLEYIIQSLAQEMERFNRSILEPFLTQEDMLSEDEIKETHRLFWRYSCFKEYEEEFAGTDILKDYYPAL